MLVIDFSAYKTIFDDYLSIIQSDMKVHTDNIYDIEEDSLLMLLYSLWGNFLSKMTE